MSILDLFKKKDSKTELGQKEKQVIKSELIPLAKEGFVMETNENVDVLYYIRKKDLEAEQLHDGWFSLQCY